MQVIKINFELVAFNFGITSPRLQIRVITEDRRKIAHVKVGELATYTDIYQTKACCWVLWNFIRPVIVSSRPSQRT